MEVLRLDGSVLEGGGQLLRIAIALSALLSRPISIHNIRGNRTPPGLKNQHAAGLRLVAEICSARLEGCELKATQVVFDPQASPRTSQYYTADPGTAGSIALLLQVSLPCLVFSSALTGEPSTLRLRGGTNAAQAPQIDYIQNVLFPFLHKHFNFQPTLQIAKRGYFPKGGGEVIVTIPPVSGPIPAITLTERGEVKVVHGLAYVAGLPKTLADSMRTAAATALTKAGINPKRIKIESVREKPTDAIGSGSGIVLWAETYEGCILGSSALGRKRVDPSRVGEDAAQELLNNLAHGGCVDEYMQDQMIIFLALAKGKSRVKTGPLTLHTRTAIWVIEQLSDARFHVEETADGAVIECDGMGYMPAQSVESSSDSVVQSDSI